MQEENRLRTEYVKLKSTAVLNFNGQQLNLSSIVPYEISPDRNTRKEAAEVKWQFYAQNAPLTERIFDDLVKVRHQIAIELGFRNFIELGYARMLRSDYDATNIADYREAIHQHVVPLAEQLYRQQATTLGLDQLNYYDEGIEYLDGNAKPQGNPDWILNNAHQMYTELSEETRQFFDFMQQHQLMDLVAKQGKAPGGYCTFIPTHGAPFIFSNFNGTSGDIDVLTHEAGHAFQMYSSRHFAISEYQFPTMEACEIHSMSMEFLTWDWMELFFGDQTIKYKLTHLSGAIKFMPYGAAIDEFQHFVYEHPTATPAERNTQWRNIEKKYLPYRNYENNHFLHHGGAWQRQAHIFSTPFYYIDYTLAQVCALQFWQKSRSPQRAEAWKDYIRLCQAGGSQSFLDLVKLANLRSPFDQQTIPIVMQEAKTWLQENKL